MFTRLTPRRLPLLVVFAAVVSFTGSAAEAAKRVALLIGNQDYQSTTPLRNPSNDVELMRKTLQEAGFEEIDVAIDVDLVGILGDLLFQVLRGLNGRVSGHDRRAAAGLAD